MFRKPPGAAGRISAVDGFSIAGVSFGKPNEASIVDKRKVRAVMTQENNAEKQQHFATLAVHGGQVVDPTRSPRRAIYQTTSYVFDDADHAGRLFALQEFGTFIPGS